MAEGRVGGEMPVLGLPQDLVGAHEFTGHSLASGLEDLA